MCHSADQKQHKSGPNRRFPSRKSNGRYVSDAPADTSRAMDDNYNSYSEENAYALGAQNNIPVLINGLKVDFVIDSGASCNNVNTEDAKQLKEINTPFKRCRRLIHPYRSPPIPCHELVSALVQIKGREPIQADFLIVPGNSPPLLGRERQRN